MAAVSCSGQNNDYAASAQLIGHAIAVQSYHSVDTSDIIMKLGGDVHIAVKRETYYVAPDKFLYKSDRKDGPLIEAIMIGDRAWRRDNEVWRAVSPDELRPFLLDEVLALETLREAKDLRRVGPGPTMGNEPTMRYRLSRPNFGRSVSRGIDSASKSISGSEPAAQTLNQLSQAYKGVKAELELTFGETTGFLYEMNVSLSGPRLTGEVHRVFSSHNKAFDIQPP